jgi:uncharacterized OB-fold protein
VNTEFPQPEVDDTSRPFWDALRTGLLTYQCCDACRHVWLPPRRECPYCLSSKSNWQVASGRAKLVSWVVYYQALHPAFTSRIPYTVAIVELAEGPRMLTNIVGSTDPESLRIDESLELVLEQEGDLAVPRFRPAERGAT